MDRNRKLVDDRCQAALPDDKEELFSVNRFGGTTIALKSIGDEIGQQFQGDLDERLQIHQELRRVALRRADIVRAIGIDGERAQPVDIEPGVIEFIPGNCGMMTAKGDLIDDINERNLITIEPPYEEQDGPFTIGGLTQQSCFFMDDDDKFNSTSSSTPITATIISRQMSDIQLVAIDDVSERGMLNKVLLLLGYASLCGHFEKNTQRQDEYRFIRTYPKLATTHLLDIEGQLVDEKRAYDLYVVKQAESVKNTWVKSKNQLSVVNRRLRSGIALAARTFPTLWLRLFGKLTPPNTCGELRNIKSLLRDCIALVDIPYQEKMMQVSIDAMLLGMAMGTSDESFVEHIKSEIPFEQHNMSEIAGSAFDTTASEVLSWQARGVLTCEVAYTRALCCFSSQTDPTKWERAKQLECIKELFPALVKTHREGGFAIDVKGLIAMQSYQYRLNELDGRKIPRLDCRGGSLLESKFDSAPTMSNNMRETKQVLAQPNLKAARLRECYSSNNRGESVYAQSVASSYDDYVDAKASKEGVQLARVASPRATCGMFERCIAWVDVQAALNGNQSSVVAIRNGLLYGTENNVIRLSTELKRFGVLLTIDDKHCLGIGNTRREYAFSNVSCKEIGIAMEMTRKTLSRNTSESETLRVLRNLIAFRDDKWRLFNCQRRLVSIHVQSGVKQRPKDWPQASGHTRPLCVGKATFEVEGREGERVKSAVVTSTNPNASILRPGGFSMKSLVLGVGAITYRFEEQAKDFCGDCAIMGTHVKQALTSAAKCGHSVPQKDVARLFDDMTSNVSEEVIQHYWKSKASLESAKQVFEKSLANYERCSIDRAVWHACLGFLTLLLKANLVKDDEDSEGDVAPEQRFRRVFTYYSEYSYADRVTIAGIIGADARWANPLVLAHLFCYQLISMDNGAPVPREIVQNVLSMPHEQISNEVCEKTGRPCWGGCLKGVDAVHTCGSCKTAYNCKWCSVAKRVFRFDTDDSTTWDTTGNDNTAEVDYKYDWDDYDPTIDQEIMVRCATPQQVTISIDDRMRKAMHDAYLASRVPTQPKILQEALELNSDLEDAATVLSSDSQVRTVIEDDHQDDGSGARSMGEIRDTMLDDESTECTDDGTVNTEQWSITVGGVIAESIEVASVTKELATLTINTRASSIEVRPDNTTKTVVVSAAKGPCTNDNDAPGQSESYDEQEEGWGDNKYKRTAAKARAMFGDANIPFTVTKPADHKVITSCFVYKRCTLWSGSEGSPWSMTRLGAWAQGNATSSGDTRNRNMYSESTSIFKCGQVHDTNGRHFCRFNGKHVERRPFKQLCSEYVLGSPGAGDVWRTRFSGDTIGEHIDQAWKYEDLLNRCVCAGCITFRLVKDPKLLAGCALDGPTWHANPQYVMKMRVLDNGANRLDVLGALNDTASGATNVLHNLAYIASSIGRVITPDVARYESWTRLGRSGLFDGDHHIDDEIIPWGTAVNVGHSVKTARTNNLIHSMTCAQRMGGDYIYEAIRDEQYKLPAKTHIFITKTQPRDEHDLGIAYRTIHNMWPLFARMWTTQWNKDSQARLSKLSTSGAAFGDFNHYYLRVSESISGDPRECGPIQVTRTARCGVDHLVKATKLSVDNETANLIREVWGEDSYALLN